MGVKLEVFRMTLYLTFPVAMFWIANQAEWFEDYVIQRKCLPPTSQPCPGRGAPESPGSCFQLLFCPHRGSCGHLRGKTSAGS
ncbi:protein PET100 homolog, mitochondrial isoform X4 [Enhydra lutris kenyoni]|uniref:Protein PET100 homolog, mitochondrial isoform X4 n=1 Tax=Enhydra lutris kenyoni TaxID=391180 RepID=A0A2Y9LDE6_ENHLU|nr:protein PET100 homolog, mitochondrial isoform X4 [Enhydra lutris kenyoni]